MQPVFYIQVSEKSSVWRGFSSRARFCKSQYSLARFGVSAEQDATDRRTKSPRLLPVAQPEPLCFSPRAPLSSGLTRLRYADKTRGKPRSIGLRADAYGFLFFLTEKFDCGQLIYKSPPSHPLRSLLKAQKIKNSLYSCILTKINFCSVSV